jgi:alpha-methylacyl-CoA racemase
VDGVMQAAPAPRFDRTPPEAPRPPSAPGADGAAILHEMGLEADAIDALRARGVLR